MPRSIWKGSLRFSLVSVPVEAYSAAQPQEGEIRFNQLHDECHSRIRYQKVCPIHGEVSQADIVPGYEYAKDQYVVLEKEDLKAAQATPDHSITLDTFIAPGELDPLYFAGNTYYLAPQNAVAEKPYALLHHAMSDLKRWGLARIVWHGKEQLVAVRTIDRMLCMSMLHYESQLRLPENMRELVPAAKVSAPELRLAQQLIEASTTDDFDFSQYRDRYTEQVKAVIDDKLEGKEIVSPPETDEAPPVINLMDALRASMKQTKRPSKTTALRGKNRGAKKSPARRRKQAG